MRAIYEFHWDCGRAGELEGLFIADKSEVERCIGEEVYFGEVLGKHSEVYGILEREDLTIKTEDQDFIEKFIEIMGEGTISGYNPITTIAENEHEDC